MKRRWANQIPLQRASLKTTNYRSSGHAYVGVMPFVDTTWLFFISSFQSGVPGSGMRESLTCLVLLKCLGKYPKS